MARPKDEQTPINQKHTPMRGFFRMAGPVLFALGALCLVAGLADFFISAADNQKPTLFWMVFIGILLLPIGGMLTQFGFLGALSRYVAQETAPVTKDTVNYLADGTQTGVSTIAAAIARGVASAADGGGEITCSGCLASNDADARFCKHCGAALVEQVSCGVCKSPNDPDARYCDSCGAAME